MVERKGAWILNCDSALGRCFHSQMHTTPLLIRISGSQNRHQYSLSLGRNSEFAATFQTMVNKQRLMPEHNYKYSAAKGLE